jgi:D-alanine-D-alanine ligase
MRTTVAVLRGGPNAHYDASVRSGSAVLSALDPERYHARDIFVNRNGYWNQSGAIMTPERALRGSDVVINCVHGRYGSDGWLRQIIAKLGHRAVGSHPGALAISFNKEVSKLAAMRLGLQAPAHQTITREVDFEPAVHRLFRSFPMPAYVKPAGGTGSYGVTLASDFESLWHGIHAVLQHAPKALVEECVAGTEATAGVVESLRGLPHFAFALGELSGAERDVVQSLAVRMHAALGLHAYSTSDFIVNSRGVWYLETNALPELHPESKFASGLAAHGVMMPEFVEHVISLAKQG